MVCKQEAETEKVEDFNTASGGRVRGAADDRSQAKCSRSGNPKVSKQPINCLEKLPVPSTMISRAAGEASPPDLLDDVMAKLWRFEKGIAVDSWSADLDRIAASRAEVENWKKKATLDEAEE
ncbi:hypothetical protein Pmar_PMAR008220 [Perkinsus marinus ATCC 50983]|uniref:Uncharacterized protein n=1 Tax=Perkinsus marinus (strain ATCC 50983 / TXsc) TaxID=423536 RepID=C5L4P9_PERM5|nr:hypothetical protein Pmar_PMAR008220 [Perkinsus marinus ATCC 50983]EER08294.1 hypothetical protein Pmar_PMAR008220 [Perkinsus marinus ATCC 50983]|eukprot:XP_002776478.1 hypothetical protein Pmar_PMAR008220 [Perkinsus marinus ATCC 50983]